MAGLTLTTADSALKEDYQPAIREQLNQKIFLLSQLEKNTKDVQGRRAVLSLHVARNSGVGARAEGGTLPSAGYQGYAEERVPLKFNYGRIQISGPSIRAMKSDNGSFTRAVDSESKGVVNDLKRDVNRQTFGTSDGKIAQCASVSSQDITLTSPTAVQLRQIEVGMVIDVGTVASPTLRGSALVVTAVNATTGVVTVTGTISASTTTTDFIFRSGAGGTGVEITGLQSIVAASGTLYNVNPSTYPSWVSTVNSNSGTNRAVTEQLLTKAANAAEILGGEASIDLWVTTDGVHRSLAASLQSQKRFSNTIELKAGYTGLALTTGSGSESAITWDRDCPSNKAFGLSTSHLMEHQMSDWEFMQEDGAILSRVSGVDAYEASLFKYHEVTTDKRNAHVLVSDLSEA